MTASRARPKGYPECFGRADCLGCIWREECEQWADENGGVHSVVYRSYGATPPNGTDVNGNEIGADE